MLKYTKCYSCSLDWGGRRGSGGRGDSWWLFGIVQVCQVVVRSFRLVKDSLALRTYVKTDSVQFDHSPQTFTTDIRLQSLINETLLIVLIISRCLEAENAMLLRRTCLMVDWENAAKAVEKVLMMKMMMRVDDDENDDDGEW